jgi:hypothetical protein
MNDHWVREHVLWPAVSQWVDHRADRAQTPIGYAIIRKRTDNTKWLGEKKITLGKQPGTLFIIFDGDLSKLRKDIKTELRAP